jgi:hypothetical protein
MTVVDYVIEHVESYAAAIFNDAAISYHYGHLPCQESAQRFFRDNARRFCVLCLSDYVDPGVLI